MSPENTPVIAAVNRCATQNQLQRVLVAYKKKGHARNQRGLNQTKAKLLLDRLGLDW
jgi:hypothetical protein